MELRINRVRINRALPVIYITKSRCHIAYQMSEKGGSYHFNSYFVEKRNTSIGRTKLKFTTHKLSVFTLITKKRARFQLFKRKRLDLIIYLVAQLLRVHGSSGLPL